MRSSDGQLAEIEARATRMRAQSRQRRILAFQAAAAATCLALIVFVTTTIPQLGAAAEGRHDGRFASLVLAGPSMGYVVVGVLAFALGVCVALLCVNLRDRYQD